MGILNLPENEQVWRFLLVYLLIGLILFLGTGMLLLKLYNDKLRKEVEREREFLKETLNQTEVLVWCVNASGVTVGFNKFGEKVTGLSDQVMIGTKDWPELLTKAGFNFVATLMTDALKLNLLNDWEASFVNPDGISYDLSLRTRKIQAPQGKQEVVILTGVNITDQRAIEKQMKQGYQELENAYREVEAAETELKVRFDELTASREYLRISEERLALAHEGSGAIIWEADLVNLTYYMSDRWYELMGYEPTGELYPQHVLFDLIHPEDAGPVEKERQDYLEGRKPVYNTEYRLRDRNGEYRWFQVRGKMLCDIEGKPYRFTGSLIDITDRKSYELQLHSSYRELELTYGELAATQSELRKQYDLLVDSRDRLKDKEEKLHKMAYYDSLSALPNRQYLLEELDRFIAAGGEWAALMFIDIDNFKNINDTLGHKYGDLVIKEIGNRLKLLLPDDLQVFRLSGDEFVVLIKEKNYRDQVLKLAGKMIRGFKLPITVNQTQLHVSNSIGIAFYPEDAGSPDDLIKSADLALYHAKNAGKGSFSVYNRSMQTKLEERMQMETQLLSALDEDEFQVYYQPQIDVKSGRIAGFEALLRWVNPELGMVPPDRFIQIAEDSRLIIPIGEWVLLTACAFLKQIHEKGHPGCTISVNISVVQLKHEHFVSSLLGILEQVGLAPNHLEIEITESILMESSELENLVNKLNTLRAMGIGIALDDFGTGYSSLSYLQELPITTLKMDKLFIDQIEDNSSSRTLASIILQIGHSLGLRMVAEGVETEGQLDFLNAHDCDVIQGYLFSRPLPEADIFKLLAARQ